MEQFEVGREMMDDGQPPRAYEILQVSKDKCNARVSCP
jgi:hypothetical protein